MNSFQSPPPLSFVRDLSDATHRRRRHFWMVTPTGSDDDLNEGNRMAEEFLRYLVETGEAEGDVPDYPLLAWVVRDMATVLMEREMGPIEIGFLSRIARNALRGYRAA